MIGIDRRFDLCRRTWSCSLLLGRATVPAPASSRSTYFAMTSTSRLTRVAELGGPERRDRERVRDHGDGERPSSSQRGDREADAVDGDRALVHDVAQHVGRRGEAHRAPTRRRWACGRATVPVPSTWPWTRWPPRRSARRTGRSRLTGSPARRSPRLVRASVSVTASAAQRVGEHSTTVRQQPLTAIESPMFASSTTRFASISMRAPPSFGMIARTWPSSSTMPVNIRPPRRSRRRSEPKLRDIDEREPRRGRERVGAGERVARLGRVRRARSVRRTRRDAGRGRLRAPRRRARRRLRRAPARLLRVASNAIASSRSTPPWRRRRRPSPPSRPPRSTRRRRPRVACSVVITSVGASGEVEERARRRGHDPRPSSSTRSGATGGAGVTPRTVSAGRSASAVPDPITIACAVGPQLVRVGARLGRGDPLRRPVGGRDLAVEARRQLGDHVRTAGAPVVQVRREDAGRGGRARHRLRRRRRRRAAGECPRRRRAGRDPRSRRRPGARRLR